MIDIVIIEFVKLWCFGILMKQKNCQAAWETNFKDSSTLLPFEWAGKSAGSEDDSLLIPHTFF